MGSCLVKLVCSKAASSNTAVNNVCKAVLPFLPDQVLRVVTEDAVDAMTEDDRRLLGPHLYPHNQLKEMISTGKNPEGKSFKKTLRAQLVEVLSRMTVVAVTCQFSVSSKTPVPDSPYQTMLIDEAGQVLEPDLVMPLTLQDKDVRVVLIGDHKQLPATVKRQP